ncbi:hypothetical protein EZY14_007430 [Kordia sp. TARA_039_SRF]|nr:hypothetical protein EZY14_007430 [Kordia sp. TARA_039_SRF]
MKNIVIITMTLFFCATPLIAVAQNENHIVIFNDKSVSVEDQTDTQNRRIFEIVNNACKAKKATIEVRFINQKTSSITNVKTFFYTESIFNASLYKKEDIEREKQFFGITIKRKRKRFAKSVLEFIKTYKAKARATEILTSLVPLSQTTGKNVDVYFFTDGIESSEYRQMDRRSFQNMQEAVQSAKKDAERIRRKFGLPKTISNISSATFVLPLDMEAKGDILSYLESYWKEVFASFGITKVTFETL